MNAPSEIVVPSTAVVSWDRPIEPAPPLTLLAIGVAGLAGAIALPTQASGIGFFVVALACAGCAWTIKREVKLLPAAWAVLSLALVGVTVLRDAYWLYILCMIGACIAGSLAVAGGRSVGGLLLGSITVTLASPIAVPWVISGLNSLRRKASRPSIRVTQSVIVSLVLLAVFVPLLTGADAAFAGVLGRLTPTVDGDSVVRWLTMFFLVGAGAAGASLAITAPPEVIPRDRRASRLARVQWAMPVGILVLLFTGFAVIQFAALFGGSDYVRRTSGMTYAEYARSGFWQLLAVTVLTLVVVAAAAHWAPRETASDRAWLRGLLGALSVLMLVVVASALSRMWAYQQAYGFTVLRLLVEACELWLGVVYLLVIAAGVRLGAGWLPRAVVGSGLTGLLVFAWLNPERMIAEHNIANNRIDVVYLSGLSADAAPALPVGLRPCPPPGDRDWRNWNLSRALRQETAQEGCGSR
jgi:hypothetical protein